MFIVIAALLIPPSKPMAEPVPHNAFTALGSNKFNGWQLSSPRIYIPLGQMSVEVAPMPHRQ